MAIRLSAETIARIAAAWDSLLQAVADGRPIGASILEHGFTPDMIRAYRRDNPAARADWEDARMQSADALADQIVDTIGNNEIDPQSARVRVDALKWLAAKRNPRVYSDRVDHNVTVRTVDLTRVIADARARIAARRARALPGTCERVDDSLALEPASAHALEPASVPAALAAIY
jgi:hypothetical protein